MAEPHPTDDELQAFAADPTQWGEPTEILTGPAAAAAGRATLVAAGVDVAELERRHVIGLAREAVENVGKPGSGTRFYALQQGIGKMAENDPAMAVIVAAARWTDRTRSGGAPARLADLTDTVEHLRDVYGECP